MGFMDWLKKLGIAKSGTASYKGDVKDAPLDYMDGDKPKEEEKPAEEAPAAPAAPAAAPAEPADEPAEESSESEGGEEG